MPRIALISNPGSGSAGDVDVAGLIAGAGVDLQSFSIEQAAAAAGSGAERIVVAGGDGSIAPAAEAAAEAGVELAVVPTGTANDFAARMGLPDEIESAVEVAVNGTGTRLVDLARIGQRPFVNVASIGLSPAAAGAAEDLKDKLGALAYTAGALRAATSEEPVRCRVECEGAELFEGEAWQVMVGCTGAFGGGSRIEADADDGRLDVVVIEAGSRAALVKHALGLRAGAVEDQKGVRSRRCREVAVEGGGELNVDGELVDCLEVGGERISFTVRPRAVRLVTG